MRSEQEDAGRIMKVIILDVGTDSALLATKQLKKGTCIAKFEKGEIFK